MTEHFAVIPIFSGVRVLEIVVDHSNPSLCRNHSSFTQIHQSFVSALYNIPIGRVKIRQIS
jgi:hypothetical protein